MSGLKQIKSLIPIYFKILLLYPINIIRMFQAWNVLLYVLGCLVVSDTLGPQVGCGQPGSSVHGIVQARIPEWVANSFSRGSSQPRDHTHISCLLQETRQAGSSALAPPGKPLRAVHA